MKKLLCLLLALIVLTSLTACGEKPAPVPSSDPAPGKTTEDEANVDKPFEGETLVVGVWGGTIEKVLRESVVEPMEEELGCSIELVLGGSSDRVVKLYTEKDNPSMDVYGLNIRESADAIINGVAAPVNPELSNFDQLYDFAQVGGYGQSIMAYGICYNNELVTEPITSWKDLWRPELKGKIAFSNFPGSEGAAIIYVTAEAWGLDLENDPDAVFAKLAELGPFPFFYTNLDELFLEIEQGNVHAAAIFNSYSNDYIAQGFPCTFVYPSDPGAILAKDTWVIAKNSKHMALAEEFVNRCIGVEAQTAYAEEIFFSPCNKNVKVSDEVAEKLVYGDDVSSLVTMEWDVITENEEEFTEKWNRMVVMAK
ncbi:MAG: hypothetical protein BWY11_01431 [Firmicutes bacterium ADurb.Bin182]|nr:MAG: hypothetical protein BWY11_01431 [Firmicutes bacterium ADurb.Bin182]